MATTRTKTIAVHVEAAKRLLTELEQHGDAARIALGRESGSEFFAAVDARDRILGELGGVVEALTVARQDSNEADTLTLVAEMARQVGAALESHERLATETRRERDRLATAVRRTARPDSIAHQYAAARTPRTRTISVTG